MEEKRVWGIHTMDDFMFLNRNVIAIGWKAMGDLATLEADREAFKKRYASVLTKCIGRIFHTCSYSTAEKPVLRQNQSVIIAP